MLIVYRNIHLNDVATTKNLSFRVPMRSHDGTEDLFN